MSDLVVIECVEHREIPPGSRFLWAGDTEPRGFVLAPWPKPDDEPTWDDR